MRMEDYKSTNNGVPIDLQFIPEALQIDFKDKLKFQIAFYRSTPSFTQTPKFARLAPKSTLNPSH